LVDLLKCDSDVQGVDKESSSEFIIFFTLMETLNVSLQMAFPLAELMGAYMRFIHHSIEIMD